MLKDNPSIHESQHFNVIENLFDTIFEKLDEAVDMSKGLLKDNQDVNTEEEPSNIVEWNKTTNG